MKSSTAANTDWGRRSGSTAAAFLIGIPLAATVLGFVLYGPGRETNEAHKVAYRYLSHPVECVEVLLFCCALGTLVVKLWAALGEKRACRGGLLPAWDGKPVPVGEAPALLALLNRQPRRLQQTWLAQRLRGAVEFVYQRRSAADLDDHLRTLADNDAIALEGSYSLTRFITWAMPILGFLGTVLGITGAIAGITPEVLENNLGKVTDGLALAFDATALALACTMVTMFCTFLVERLEQGVLEAVDQVVDRELAHRFERSATEQAPFLDAVRHSAQLVLDTTTQLVQRQAELWANTLAEVERRSAASQAQQQQQLVAALELAISSSLEQHAQRLAAAEKQSLEQTAALVQQMTALAGAVRETGREQQAALVRVADGVADQAAVLGQLQGGEQHLIQLQTLLQQNLAALAQAGAFDQAVHSLTAAIHLLMSRAGGSGAPTTPPNLARAPLGKAA
jgi:biopolymer transport protein ExbB/TolQ